MALPKLEGMFTIPTGGYTFSINEGGGAQAVTIPAGQYFLTSGVSGGNSLLTEIGNQATAVGGLAGTYTLSVSDTDGSATGKVTISCSGATPTAFTWTSTALRDWIGFSGSESVGATTVGDNHAERLWLPNVRRAMPRTSDASTGLRVSDYTITVAPNGVSKRLAYNKRFVGDLTFNYLDGKKTKLEFETVVNESLETFWIDVIYAGHAVRYYTDRSVDSTYLEWVLTGGHEFVPDPAVPGWVGSSSTWNWSSQFIGYVAS